LADIGTDHAYLPIFLLQEGHIASAIAADINPLPLQKARDNIAANGAEGRVKALLSNGLEAVLPESVDDIVIAGMGGELIAKILVDCRWIKNAGYNLILQPMTRPEALRSYLFENGFELLREEAVEEAGKAYVVINSAYTGRIKPFTASDIYIGKLRAEDPASRKYLSKVYTSLLKAKKGAELTCDAETAAFYQQAILKLEALI
jgi:tRNA (adenine22-N1)-methyltransferase